MVRIEFLGPINKNPMEVEAKSLQELSDYLKKDETLVSWLENCAIAINDTMVTSKDVNLNDGDKISLLPPVCGG